MMRFYNQQSSFQTFWRSAVILIVGLFLSHPQSQCGVRASYSCPYYPFGNSSFMTTDCDYGCCSGTPGFADSACCGSSFPGWIPYVIVVIVLTITVVICGYCCCTKHAKNNFRLNHKNSAIVGNSSSMMEMTNDANGINPFENNIQQQQQNFHRPPNYDELYSSSAAVNYPQAPTVTAAAMPPQQTSLNLFSNANDLRPNPATTAAINLVPSNNESTSQL